MWALVFALWAHSTMAAIIITYRGLRKTNTPNMRLISSLTRCFHGRKPHTDSWVTPALHLQANWKKENNACLDKMILSNENNLSRWWKVKDPGCNKWKEYFQCDGSVIWYSPVSFYIRYVHTYTAVLILLQMGQTYRSELRVQLS